MEVGERNGVGVPKEAQSKETHSKGTQSYGSSVYSAKLDWDFLKQGRLFERKNERKMLIRGFQRRLQPNSKPELLLLSGGSGTGKTSLALQLKKYVTQRRVCFVMGKFDQMKRVEPYAPIIFAITRFIHHILDCDAEIITHTRNSILKAIDKDIGILTFMIPALEKLVGRHETNPLINPLKGADVESRFKGIFCRFMNAACSSSVPLVLVMDDLQWADLVSLELLEGIVSDPYNHSLMVVGICRSNEITITHDLAKFLRRLEDERETGITNIDVGRFSIKGTNQLISTVLHQPEKMCVSIAMTLYKKTGGNPLFLVELLKALDDNHVLLRDKRNIEWLWDEGRWHNEFFHVENTTDLFIQRIQNLSTDCQLLLSTCACLGTEIDELLISKIMANKLNGQTVQECLSICETEMIIYRDDETSRYRFSHDRTQQASYCLINIDECAQFHLAIGRLLLRDLSEHELNQYIFVVVDQMNRGIEADVPLEAEEKHQLASVCLEAGERSMQKNDFKTALKYLMLGKSLLDLRREWRDNYVLILGLENGIAQASCLTAEYAKVEEAVQEISIHARSYEDKIPGYSLLIYVMSTTMRFQEALDLGLEVLERLGEKIPMNAKKFNVITSLVQAKRILRGKSDEDILALPDMTDSKKLSAMSILNLIVVATYVGHRELFPFVAMAMVRLSLKYGLSAISSMAFATYGALLIATGDINEGYRFSSLGVSILHKRFASVKAEWVPRVYCIHHGMVSPWKNSLNNDMEILYHAYERSIETGDLEYTHLMLFLYVRGKFQSGCSLLSQESTLRNAVETMRKLNQRMWAELTNLQLEITLVLIGKEEDPVVTNGLLMHLEDPSNKLQELMSIAGLRMDVFLVIAASNRMIVAYHIGDMETALRMEERSKDFTTVNGAAVFVIHHSFYAALTCLTVLRDNLALSKPLRKKLLAQARTHLKYLQKRCKYNPKTIESKQLLIEAEFEALNGKMYPALAKYAKAQELAKREESLDVQALACERASITIHEGRGNEAQKFFLIQLSIELYAAWGAKTKVQLMKGLLDDWNSLTKYK